MAHKDNLISSAEMQDDKRTLAQNFKHIRDNNLRYANFTAQLQRPSTRSAWIETFKKRAVFSAQMYDENNEINDAGRDFCIKHYVDGLKDYSNDLKFTDISHLQHTSFTFYYFKKIGNIIYLDRKHPSIPFVMEEACLAYEKDFERLMPQSELTFLLYATELRIQFQIAQLGDAMAYKKIVSYAHKALAFEDRYDTFSHDFLRLQILEVYRYLLDVRVVCSGALTADEVIDFWSRYQVFKQKHKEEPHKSSYHKLLDEIHYYIGTFIPVYAINYHRTHDDSVHDPWLRAELIRYVDQYDATSDPYNYQLYAFSKYLLKQCTINEAYDSIVDHYNRLNWKLTQAPSIPALITILLITKQTLGILTQTDYPYEVKQQRIRQSLQLAVDQIKKCNSIHLDAELSNIICRFLNNHTTVPYLNSKQRLRFIQDLFRSSLVQTYAHCRMVALISEEILDGIIRYRPELLVGYMGINSVDEVEAHAYQLNDFVHGAAMYHDIGKLTMIQIVNNDHCRLMDHEFEILKEHPERGLQFLDLDPSLSIYHDTVLGHHKWYDGKGGYPASFDNTRSPHRLFIDILSIADCFEAATDNLGRSYNRKKEFSDLFAEMYEQAGTRYNPDVLEVISKNSHLYRVLSNLIHEGWEYNYYEVYLDYFGMR